MAKYLDKIGLSYFWSLIKSKLIPAGGQQGQVLAKASAADDDVAWVSAGVNNLIGDNLVAASNRQIVIGQYNEEDDDSHAIIVGNGTDDEDRKNTAMLRRDGELFLIDNDFPTTTPSSDYTKRVIHFATDEPSYDPTDNIVGYLQTGVIASNNRRYIELGARRHVGDSSVFNTLRLAIMPDGTRVVDLYPDPWIDALGLGTRYTKSSMMSITTVNSDISGPAVTVPSGVYIVVVTYTFATGASSGSRDTTVGFKAGNNTFYNKVMQATNAAVRMSYVDVIATTLSSLTITSYIRSSMKCGNGMLYISATRIG